MTNKSRTDYFKKVMQKLFYTEGKKDKSWEKNMFSEMNRLRGKIVIMRSR